jgi:MFS family permease
MQAIFSGVWGVASIAGPLVGGYITDALSWRWVFLINLPGGLLALGIIASAYPAGTARTAARVDWPGAALLFGSVTALLVALGGTMGPMWAWLLAAVAMAAALVGIERRDVEPMLPLDLFHDRVVSRTLLVAFLVGTAMFGAIAFMPLYVQAVLGGTATQAGTTLTPLFLGWVLSSIAGARLSVRRGYRRVTSGGVALIAAGFAALAMLGGAATRQSLLGAALILGCGMGLSMLSLLLAIQHGVDRARLGLATSLNQFARSIGAAVGVALMGALLARSMSGLELPGGAHGVAAGTIALDASSRAQLAAALRQVFTLGAGLTLLALLACTLLPHVDFSRDTSPRAGEVLIEAEMTMLEAGGEPRCVEDARSPASSSQ